MFVRLALENECEDIVRMAKMNVSETLPAELDRFDPDCVRDTFGRYLNEAATTFFVVEENRAVIAFLQACMYGYDYRPGLYTVQKVLFVTQEKRRTGASVMLMQELIRWSRLIGADRIEGGNDNDFQSERTAKFLSHFGFEKVGYAMRLELDVT